jgi:hypothetical protein
MEVEMIIGMKYTSIVVKLLIIVQFIYTISY